MRSVKEYRKRFDDGVVEVIAKKVRIDFGFGFDVEDTTLFKDVTNYRDD